ncbi:methylamine utilization protein [Pelomonas sp. SE-A7]|uniref:methylamine utilization protein n=1 Tax=Pelomonas sp. SE-A7 TaxID=3054953 RepID=UPI00259CDFFD|nr:methylamine utilization protein [Pelomonas sp. SE-A7]MDM4766962.1 methylamine utilization protein [Pelomonas sp. SE-A7]
MRQALTLAVAPLLLCLAPQALSASWTVQVRSPDGKPLQDAVVAVEIKGQRSTASGVKAEVAQRERQFIPYVLVVQTGTAVNFPNFDTVRHHVYSFSPTKKFDLKLYAGTPAEPVLFDKPGVATLGCNIHDQMSAHVVVVDTPVFAKTDARGLVQLELPAGEHQLKTWHPRSPEPRLQSQALSVGAAAGQTVVTLQVE